MVMNRFRADELLAFDFDGVICNSAPELAATAWRVLTEQGIVRPGLPQHLLESFCRVRPMLQTGFEAILLVAALRQTPWKALLAESHCVARLLAEDAAAHGVSREARANYLKDQFAAARDSWIETDVESWLCCHTYYTSVVIALKSWLAQGRQLRIITTKQRRFTCLLLNRAGLELPEAHVFGLDEGPKIQVLTSLQRQYRTIHFFEDRLQTLLDVAAQQDLRTIGLYLVDWGYNRPADRILASTHERIELVCSPLDQLDSQESA